MISIVWVSIKISLGIWWKKSMKIRLNLVEVDSAKFLECKYRRCSKKKFCTTWFDLSIEAWQRFVEKSCTSRSLLNLSYHVACWSNIDSRFAWIDWRVLCDWNIKAFNRTHPRIVSKRKKSASAGSVAMIKFAWKTKSLRLAGWRLCLADVTSALTWQCEEELTS